MRKHIVSKVNIVRTYLIMYFCPETERWECDKMPLSSRAVPVVLRDYEKVGCLHPYEVMA